MKFKNYIIRTKKIIKLALTATDKILESALKEAEISKISDKNEKYEARYKFISQKASLLGFPIYNKRSYWVNDPEFDKIWLTNPDKNQRRERKYVAWQMALATKNLQGHTAECGVLFGATSHIICKVNKGKDKFKHHVFDSFEGLSEPVKSDKNIDNGFVWKKGDLSVSLEVVMNNLSEFDFVKYYKGWIPNRFKEVKDLKFSFVHIDVDLYQPTLDSLIFFFPRMVNGGIILCDDYGSEICPGAKMAFDEFSLRNQGAEVIGLPTQQGFIVKKIL